MMDVKRTKKLLAMLAAFFWALVLMIYVVAGEQFHYTQVTSSALSPVAVIGEIVDGMEITQRLHVEADRIDSIALMADTYGRENTGTLHIHVLNESGVQAAELSVEAAALHAGQYTSLALETPIEGMRGQDLILRLTTQGCAPGNAVTLYYGNSVTTGRFDILKVIEGEDLFTIDGNAGAGMLCVTATGVERLSFYKTYWIIVPAIFAVLALWMARCWRGAMQGRSNALTLISTIYCRYDFLIKQLVIRDFKAKYKRSVLGVFWSFLNPLMTMAVQYMVFSTVFKSDIPNYPVYLLTGTVFFNFFNEAVGTGMIAITGNAHLIKKVYMPRYIYPIAKVLSSLVNFGIAIIPLVLLVIFTGVPMCASWFLLIFDILCMLMFVLGMVLVLATFMTFFQDTQFLWNVVSMMWMYITPIFYPESIIPQQLLPLYHMNPMYQYITFARVAISGGISPAPTAYLWCLLSSLAVLAVGVKVFNKYQDEFVLHL